MLPRDSLGPLLWFCVAGFWTEARGKSFLLEPKHWKFTGCEAYSRCVAKMMLSLLQVLPLQVVNEDLDINEGNDIHRAAKAYLKAIKSSKSGHRPRFTYFMFLKGLPSVHGLFPHMIQYMRRYHMDMEMLDNERHRPFTLGSDTGLSYLSFLKRAHFWLMYKEFRVWQ